MPVNLKKGWKNWFWTGAQSSISPSVSRSYLEWKLWNLMNEWNFYFECSLKQYQCTIEPSASVNIRLVSPAMGIRNVPFLFQISRIEIERSRTSCYLGIRIKVRFNITPKMQFLVHEKKLSLKGFLKKNSHDQAITIKNLGNYVCQFESGKCS